MEHEQKVKILDLRGVACPLSWAKARVVLDGMRRGERLRLLVDAGRAVRDIPRAAEAMGYAVESPLEVPEGWRLEIVV
ncbi:sulfurtransferase TusA family protein [bacterium]|nr:sulfurtransferase TusA family protein [bacterium]